MSLGLCYPGLPPTKHRYSCKCARFWPRQQTLLPLHGGGTTTRAPSTSRAGVVSLAFQTLTQWQEAAVLTREAVVAEPVDVGLDYLHVCFPCRAQRAPSALRVGQRPTRQICHRMPGAHGEKCRKTEVAQHQSCGGRRLCIAPRDPKLDLV